MPTRVKLGIYSDIFRVPVMQFSSIISSPQNKKQLYPYVMKIYLRKLSLPSEHCYLALFLARIPR